MEVKAWLGDQWVAFQRSYDPNEVMAGSHPRLIVITAAVLTAVIGAIAYAPPLRAASDFRQAWLALLLVAAGSTSTYVAWKHRCRGRTGTLAAMLDNGFYSAALTHAAVNTSESYGLGLAIAHGLMVVAFPAQSYGLTPLFALVMLVPLVIGVGVYGASVTVVVVLLSTYVVGLIAAMVTGRRRDLLHEQVQLRRAISAAAEVADESVQAALATTLLSLGHLLHELRNAQTVVRSNLSFIEMQADLNEEAREALNDALEAQTEEERLIVETIESLKRRAKPVDASFILSDAVDAAAASSDVVVSMHSRNPFEMNGVAAHLEGVLTNLIRNARQAGANSVHIVTRLEPSGRAVELTVHDDGPGIPVEQREELFKPFATFGKVAGTGLGLYLCRRHVELFGGSIAVGGGPLGGAAFVMVLPGTSLPVAKTPAVV